jgi:hypothetical protein
VDEYATVYGVPTANQPSRRRKRCLNDNKLFIPARNVPDQKFCSDACRKEFHHHGSAFGPMKLGLYARIDKKYAALEKTMKTELRVIGELLRHLQLRVDALIADYDWHTHEIFVANDTAESSAPKRVLDRLRKQTGERDQAEMKMVTLKPLLYRLSDPPKATVERNPSRREVKSPMRPK